MIVLDTNIVSVLARPDHPDLPIINAWRQASLDRKFRVTAISRAEIAYGIAILPEGARKRRLAAQADQFFAPLVNLTLPFGFHEADAFGIIMADRRAKGHPMSILDAQIAAIAKVAGATVATRDTKDFLDCGIAVVNPYAL